MSAKLLVKLDGNVPPKPVYYAGMLDGTPRFGPKHKAVRVDDDLAKKVASKLERAWKIECQAMPEDVRYGGKQNQGRA